MELIELTSITGSVFTALSVLFAIYVFRRRQDSSSFASFRTGLVDIRSNINSLSKAISDESITEICACITNQLRSIFPSGAKKEDVIDLLTDKTKIDYVITAMHLGLRDSGAMSQTLKTIEKLDRIPFEHEVRMPLTTEIIQLSTSIITHWIITVTSPAYFRTALFEGDDIKSTFEQIEKLDNVDLMFREIIEIFRVASYASAIEFIGGMLSSVQIMIDILVKTISKKDDSELRKYQLKDHKLYKHFSPEKDASDIDKIFHYMKLIKDEFASDDWDIIVESKAKYDQILERIDRA